MPNIAKVSIALPSEMLDKVHEAVESGEYASSSEVVRDALRSWQDARRLRSEEIAFLRKAWKEGMQDRSPGTEAHIVIAKLRDKYGEKKH